MKSIESWRARLNDLSKVAERIFNGARQLLRQSEKGRSYG